MTQRRQGTASAVPKRVFRLGALAPEGFDHPTDRKAEAQ